MDDMTAKEEFIFLFKAYLKQAEADVVKWTKHLERLEGKKEPVAEVALDCRVMGDLGKAAQSLFDNRLGWSSGANPFATRDFWADLGAALYGEDDPRVKELRDKTRP